MNNPFFDFKIIELQDLTDLIAKLEGTIAKGVFVCYAASETEYEAFLSKILSAINLDLKTEVLVLKETLETGFSFSQLQTQRGIKIALVFGYLPQHLGVQVNYQKYQPFIIKNCTFLFADKLAKISEDKKLKTLLWKALQTVFL